MRIFSETRIRCFTLAFIAHLLSVYLFTVRWQQVLCFIGYNLKATNLVPVIFGGILTNNLTPASRAGGESLRIFCVNKKFGINYTNAFISILLERLVEIIHSFLLLIIALYLFSSLKIEFLSVRNSLKLNSTYLLLLGFFVAGLAIWLFRIRFSSLVNIVGQNCKQLHKSFIAVLFLSSGIWTFDFIRLKLIASALNLPRSLHLITTISILYLLPGSLPITPEVFGIVEGSLIFIRLYFRLLIASRSSFISRTFYLLWAQQRDRISVPFYYGGFKIWKSAKLH